MTTADKVHDTEQMARIEATVRQMPDITISDYMLLLGETLDDHRAAGVSDPIWRELESLLWTIGKTAEAQMMIEAKLAELVRKLQT